MRLLGHMRIERAGALNEAQPLRRSPKASSSGGATSTGRGRATRRATSTCIRVTLGIRLMSRRRLDLLVVHTGGRVVQTAVEARREAERPNDEAAAFIDEVAQQILHAEHRAGGGRWSW